MKRLLSNLHLNLLAGIIALGILAVSGQTLWADRTDTWQEAEKSSRNIVNAIARDLTSSIELLDLSLKGVIEGLQYPDFQKLSPDLQRRILFDRSALASLKTSLVVLNESGDIIADAASGMSPRAANYADRDYFQVHKENPLVGIYVSRPYRSRLRNGEYSFAVSRRLSHSDGSFAGVVVSGITLSNMQALFGDLNLGEQGTLGLFRGDGILLTRRPFDENQVGRDFGATPNIQQALREQSGSLEAVSQLDGVRRLLTFERLERYPLLLTVSVSVDEVFASWRKRALILGRVTFALCAAVVALTVLFQRQLRLRAKAEVELAQLATTDALTGLANRRAFDDVFEREWRQAIRSQAPISLLYIDNDCFKSFNDQYGHSRGDDLLSLVAGAIEANIRRPRDIAARYGGEEFVVLLPETDLAGAEMIAGKICRAIAGLGVSHNGNPHRVATASIGAASARPSLRQTRVQLLKTADAALYHAKAVGKNRVHIASVGGAVSEAAAAE